MSTYPLLCQLPRSLILTIPQQFDDTALIRCESAMCPNESAIQSILMSPIFSSLQSTIPRLDCRSNIPRNLFDDLPDESCPFAEMTFGARDARFEFAGGGFLSLLATFCIDVRSCTGKIRVHT